MKRACAAALAATFTSVVIACGAPSEPVAPPPPAPRPSADVPHLAVAGSGSSTPVAPPVSTAARAPSIAIDPGPPLGPPPPLGVEALESEYVVRAKVRRVERRPKGGVTTIVEVRPIEWLKGDPDELVGDAAKTLVLYSAADRSDAAFSGLERARVGDEVFLFVNPPTKHHRRSNPPALQPIVGEHLVGLRAWRRANERAVVEAALAFAKERVATVTERARAAKLDDAIGRTGEDAWFHRVLTFYRDHAHAKLGRDIDFDGVSRIVDDGVDVVWSAPFHDDRAGTGKLNGGIGHGRLRWWEVTWTALDPLLHVPPADPRDDSPLRDAEDALGIRASGAITRNVSMGTAAGDVHFVAARYIAGELRHGFTADWLRRYEVELTVKEPRVVVRVDDAWTTTLGE